MIHHGDCLDVLKILPDNSFDSLVTDPPYGLSKEPDIAEVMKYWLAGDRYQHKSAGFMGKDWDSFVPGPEYWQEVFRVMKPGAYGLVFAGTRTWDLMSIALRFAGFEIRDCVQWLYGQGFPKSLNISKAIDKLNGDERPIIGIDHRSSGRQFAEGKSGFARGDVPITSAASAAWEGWGTALKPAWEPAILIRKPISEKNVAANVLKHGVGGINIDGCRVGNELRFNPPTHKTSTAGLGDFSMCKGEGNYASGRFPANVILDEEAGALLDEQSGISKPRAGRKAIKGGNNGPTSWTGLDCENHVGTWPADPGGGASRFFYCAKTSPTERNSGLQEFLTWDSQDQNLQGRMAELSQLVKGISEDTIGYLVESSWNTDLYGHSISEQYQKDLMFTISTVIKLITELRTSNCSQSSTIRGNILDAIRTIEVNGLSLAESVDAISQLDRTSTKDEMASVLGVSLALLKALLEIRGCAKHGNTHPTLKPQKLMRYLCKLVTPPGGHVLDPFAGSGSTGVAAKAEGFVFTGIEMNDEYVEIAKRRIEGVN